MAVSAKQRGCKTRAIAVTNVGGSPIFRRRNLQPAALAARNLHCASTPQVANTADFAAKRHGTVVATPLRTFAYGSSHEPQS